MLTNTEYGLCGIGRGGPDEDEGLCALDFDMCGGL